jgi:hypothetical protein
MATASAATIDLGDATRVDVVVVRGCRGCVVETSLDGGSWSRIANGRSFRADARPRQRGVRVAAATHHARRVA